MCTRVHVIFWAAALALASACGTSSSGSSTDIDTGAPLSPDGGGYESGLPGGHVDGSLAPDVSAADAGSADATSDGGGDAAAPFPADGASPDAGAADTTTSTESGTDATKPAESGADAAVASFYLGADVSFVQQEEDEGRHFYDVDGTEGDIFQILKNHGFNYIRLRTFVNPLASDGYDTANGTTTAYCDTAHTVTMGARAKAAGMGLLVDFHYSDNWADPGKQCVPVSWQGYTTMTELASALQTYTSSVITALVAGNARPDMVQIGNEITPGMLLDICDSTGTPTGTVPRVSGSNSTNFDNIGALLKAGIAGVKAVDGTIKIMEHIDRGGDHATTTWWVDGVMGQGVTFDVLGESCYTNYQGDPSTWQTNFADLVAQYPTLSFVIAEYDEDSKDLAGNTECPSTTGPCNVWRRANDIAFGLANKKGLGTFIWEPTEYEESLFDDQGKTSTLTDAFGSGARIQLYDQMVTAYGL